MSSYSLL